MKTYLREAHRLGMLARRHARAVADRRGRRRPRPAGARSPGERGRRPRGSRPRATPSSRSPSRGRHRLPFCRAKRCTISTWPRSTAGISAVPPNRFVSPSSGSARSTSSSTATSPVSPSARKAFERLSSCTSTSAPAATSSPHRLRAPRIHRRSVLQCVRFRHAHPGSHHSRGDSEPRPHPRRQPPRTACPPEQPRAPAAAGQRQPPRTSRTGQIEAPSRPTCMSDRFNREQPLVQRERLRRGDVPAEALDGPRPPGSAHRFGACRVGEEFVDLLREARGEGGRIGRRSRSVRARLVRDEQPRDAVLDHLGDAADRGRDDRSLAGHRLEVDDPHRLVDRRAHEHGCVAEDLDHVRLGHISSIQITLPRAVRTASTLRRVSRAISGVSGLRRRARAGRPGGSPARLQQVREPLLARDPADEDNRRAPGSIPCRSSTSVPRSGRYSSASILAILVVHNDDDLPSLDRSDGRLNRGESETSCGTSWPLDLGFLLQAAGLHPRGYSRLRFCLAAPTPSFRPGGSPVPAAAPPARAPRTCRGYQSRD